MRIRPTPPLVLLLVLLAAVLGSACSDDGETCADGDCSSGSGGSTSGITSSSSTTGQGGSGGGGEPLHTEVVFTSYLTGEPLAHEIVVVNAADGSVVAQTLTGTDGSVPVEIPAGGSVSVFYTFSFWGQGIEYPVRNAQTVFPGDARPQRIALEDGGFYEAEPGPGVMEFGLYWDTFPGAGTYVAKTNCFNKSVAAPELYANELMTGCTEDGLYDAVFAVYDQAGALLDYSLLPDQPFMAGGKLAHHMTPGQNEVGEIPYTVTNLPDTVSTSVSLKSVATLNSHGAPITLEQAVGPEFPDGAETSGTVRHAVGFGDQHCTDVVVRFGNTNVEYNRCGDTPDLRPIALDASRLARFAIVPPLTATSVSWDQSFEGELGDFVVAIVAPDLDGASVSILWTAFAPAGAGSVTRPELPAGLEDYALPDVEKATVTNVDLHDTVGFAAALERGSLSRNRDHAGPN